MSHPDSGTEHNYFLRSCCKSHKNCTMDFNIKQSKTEEQQYEDFTDVHNIFPIVKEGKATEEIELKEKQELAETETKAKNNEGNTERNEEQITIKVDTKYEEIKNSTEDGNVESINEQIEINKYVQETTDNWEGIERKRDDEKLSLYPFSSLEEEITTKEHTKDEEMRNDEHVETINETKMNKDIQEVSDDLEGIKGKRDDDKFSLYPSSSLEEEITVKEHTKDEEMRNDGDVETINETKMNKDIQEISDDLEVIKGKRDDDKFSLYPPASLEEKNDHEYNDAKTKLKLLTDNIKNNIPHKHHLYKEILEIQNTLSPEYRDKLERRIKNFNILNPNNSFDLYSTKMTSVSCSNRNSSGKVTVNNTKSFNSSESCGSILVETHGAWGKPTVDRSYNEQPLTVENETTRNRSNKMLSDLPQVHSSSIQRSKYKENKEHSKEEKSRHELAKTKVHINKNDDFSRHENNFNTPVSQTGYSPEISQSSSYQVHQEQLKKGTAQEFNLSQNQRTYEDSLSKNVGTSSPQVKQHTSGHGAWQKRNEEFTYEDPKSRVDDNRHFHKKIQDKCTMHNTSIVSQQKGFAVCEKKTHDKNTNSKIPYKASFDDNGTVLREIELELEKLRKEKEKEDKDSRKKLLNACQRYGERYVTLQQGDTHNMKGDIPQDQYFTNQFVNKNVTPTLQEIIRNESPEPNFSQLYHEATERAVTLESGTLFEGHFSDIVSENYRTGSQSESNLKQQRDNSFSTSSISENQNKTVQKNYYGYGRSKSLVNQSPSVYQKKYPSDNSYPSLNKKGIMYYDQYSHQRGTRNGPYPTYHQIQENSSQIEIEAAEEVVEDEPLEIIDVHKYFCDDFDLKKLNESVDKITQINTVEKWASTFEDKVFNFSEAKGSLEYFIIDEKLMRFIEHLDKLKCREDPEATKRKIQVIQYIKNLQSLLDSRASDD